MDKGQELASRKIGWIGAGRMGYAMAQRLLKAGCDVSIYNRTRAKAEPLIGQGGKVVDTPRQLADMDIVFTMVSGPDDLHAVICGDNGLLSASNAPKLVIDCSSVSEEGSLRVREALSLRGSNLLSAPVSGNAKVIKAGKLTIVASGPVPAFETARPYLEALGKGVTYVGEGELARMVKICHNVLLGVVTQSLAEITVLAEKGGVRRSALLNFINDSVMGSMFTRYKSPALVNLDWVPTFTAPLLRKDMDLGLSAGKRLGVPMPVAETTRRLVQEAIDAGHTECDFGILLEMEAKASHLELVPENIAVDDGLS
ncbi:MAG: NAD(P)-dependent oxidoreductase [Gammaproteobacteria bacterium]|nr:NAD(P)-dependent oxidoreductase [Gammaproteobacteria bacterium]MDH5310638.1 NAD(P)-dependent oxidoreductase [Gammaproteobacteria bacterium]